jgi:hypothetical protein
MWKFFGRDGYIILITTSGSRKKNGRAVMGKGCASEARLKIPGIDRLLGAHLDRFGNNVMLTDRGYGTFPTKHQWFDKFADLDLIARSAQQLRKFTEHPDFRGKTFILARPGCGLGGLEWSQVRPLLEDLPDNVHIISKSVF